MKYTLTGNKIINVFDPSDFFFQYCNLKENDHFTDT